MNNIIEQGTVIKSNHGLKYNVNYCMCFLDSSHIDEIIGLQETIKEHLEDKRLFVSDTKDFILGEILPPGKGLMIGTFSEGRLIAYRSISFKNADDKNLGKILNIPEEELDRVVHLEATVVHPDYRGNRLQLRMLRPTINYIKTSGYFHIISTVSPFNYPSLKNILEGKLTIKLLERMSGSYQGKLRFILSRDMRLPLQQHHEPVVEIDNTDIERQMQILKDGFTGYALKKTENDTDIFKVVYGKPAPPHFMHLFHKKD